MRLVVVCDLDNTLLHSQLEQQWRGFSDSELNCLELKRISFKQTAPSSVEETLLVKLRPGAVDLLKSLVRHDIEVYIFTAAQESYARAVLDLLDPECLIPRTRIFARQHLNGEQKQLSHVLRAAGASRENVVIIDDRRDVWSACGATQNVLQVPPYHFFDPQRDETPSVLTRIGRDCIRIAETVPTLKMASALDMLGSISDASPLKGLVLLFSNDSDIPDAESWLDKDIYSCRTTWSADVTHVLGWSSSEPTIRDAYRIPFLYRPIVVTPEWLWKSVAEGQLANPRDFPVHLALASFNAEIAVMTSECAIFSRFVSPSGDRLAVTTSAAEISVVAATTTTAPAAAAVVKKEIRLILTKRSLHVQERVRVGGKISFPRRLQVEDQTTDREDEEEDRQHTSEEARRRKKSRHSPPSLEQHRLVLLHS